VKRVGNSIVILAGLGICLPIAFAEGTGAAGSKDKSCGPPSNYCARTDRRVEPYAKTPPAIGKANSSVTDPNFGSRIARVTDDRSDPRRPGGPLMTPSSAEQNPWNATGTGFYVMTSGGGYLLYDFDPATMTARPSRVSDVPWGGEPQFSYTRSNILYGMANRSTVLQQLDMGTGKVTSINDGSQCVKLNSADTGHSMTVSADDNRMMTSFGPQQNANYVIYVYDRSQGCRWYNTETGEIGGKWGAKGTVSTPDRYTVHNARMSKSGKYIYIARAKPSPGHQWVVWDVETTNAVVCTQECSGHRVLGYSHIVSPSGRVHPLDLRLRPLDHLETSIPLIKDLEHSGYWYDQHFSWNNVDPNDTNPVCFSTYRPSNPDTPGTPLQVDGPWENEIDCVEVDGKDSKVWRFAHTYSTAKNGFWSTPRGNVSPDGRFFMFTSDWQDQLGQAPNGKNYRTDVFVVELK
jgi:hypothetical protein